MACAMNFPQCAVGLVSPEGDPLRKWTTLWANSPWLIKPFRHLGCNCQMHGEIAGSYRGVLRSKLAQVWPRDMCRRIVEGICLLLKAMETRGAGVHAYPAVVGEGKKRARPRKYPEEAIFDCKACKRRFPMTDRKHTRDPNPPNMCRFWDVEGDERITCEGCVANRSYDHPSHTGNEANCRVPDPRSHGVRRGAGPHRDPAVAAAGSSTDRNPASAALDLDRPLEYPSRGWAFLHCVLR